jgi:beta-glucosidase
MEFMALAATWDVELVGRLGGPTGTAGDPVLTERINAALARGGSAAPDAAELAASYVLARNHGSFLPLTARTTRKVVVLGGPLPGIEATDDEVRGADLVVVNFDGDHERVARVAEANPRTVVVLSERVELPWLALTPSVLITWGANDALAAVIYGAAEPGGRMPGAWPEFRFGHGLGYTHWQYLAIAGATVRLANTGTRRGREVVQLYDGARLAGFTDVDADASQEVIVDVPIETEPTILRLRWS